MTIKSLRSASFLTVPLILMCGVLAHGDQWDKRTKITVNESIEVPGAVLPAGTYIFRLYDSPSDRHVVQVFNEREDHVFASIIAIPNIRLTPTGKTVLTFYEVPAGQPVPVHAWFYPGDDFGQEFIYPNERTFNLSESSGTATVTTNNPVVAEEILEPLPSEVATAEPAPVATTPEAAPVVAANEPPTPPAALPVEAAPTPVMPETASNVPLLTLAGLLLIGGALTAGSFAKRMG